MKHLNTYLLLIYIILFSSNIQSETRDWQNIEVIEDLFFDIALNNEYHEAETVIRKWNKTIRIHVIHQVGDIELHSQLLSMHTRHLTKITNHPIEFVDTAREANLLYYFTHSYQAKQLIEKKLNINSGKLYRDSVCIGSISLNKDNSIRQGIIIIPVDKARYYGKLTACIIEEVTQLMGLPNDTKKNYPTIFSDFNANMLLTGLDYLLLKLLYDKEVKSGMGRKELRPIIRKKLIQWDKDETIRNAQNRVVQGELYGTINDQ